MHQAHGGHADAPEDHDGGDEDAGPQALEQDVGEGFEAGVGDKEEGEGGVVFAVAHAEVVDEAVDFGVAGGS